jgi:hypothetical protein
MTESFKPISIKDSLKEILYGFLFMITFISLVYFLKLNFYAVIGIMLAIQAGIMLYKGEFALKTLGLSLIFMLAVYGVSYMFKPLGVWGFFLTCFALAAFTIWRRWKKFIQVKWTIESMLFGKPLKDYRISGEKPPKLF